MDSIKLNLLSSTIVKALLYSALATLLTACGGGGGENGDAEQNGKNKESFVIGGSITGLSESGSLIIQNNSTDDLRITKNGTFSFSTSLNDTEKYSVTILSQPANPNQVCSITNETGTLASENIINIDITCITTQYTISGSVSGLTDSESLTLQNNADDDLIISTNGNFTFATEFDHLAPYHITISDQSITADRSCIIANPTGQSTQFTNIEISCASNPYTVGGTVSGFSEIGNLVLQNNAGDDLTISANGSFSFPSTLIHAEGYDVSVLTQPSNPNQTCLVSHASGVIEYSNISNISIVCTTTQYTVQGTVSGLASSGNLILENNASDDLKVPDNGNFTFSTPLDHLSDFSVTISSQPSGADQICVIANPTGKVTPLTNIEITCTSIPHTVGGTVSGFNEIGDLVLQNNAGDDLTITANGDFVFPTTLIKSDQYAVSVLTQPSNPNQICSITNASGTIAKENIDNISITCAAQQYTVGGTVTDLTGSDLVLQNNSGDNLTINANGAFTFATPIDDLSAFTVSVLTPPNSPAQPCRVSNNQGTIAGANATDVAITCSPDFYVSIDDVQATDSGTGTQAEPFMTIKAAIDFTSSFSGSMDIHIAEGSYDSDNTSANQVVMAEGISMYGGYSSVDWSVRNPSLYPSILSHTSNEDSEQTILVGTGITDATIIDGFTINGPDSLQSHAIYVDTSSPTISNNIINGYEGGDYTYGIYVKSGNPIISNNTINGGAGQYFSFGIKNEAGNPSIFENSINGGTAGDGSSAIHNVAGTANIYKNEINGGGGFYKSRGIANESTAFVVIYNNKIEAGTSGGFSYGIKNFSGVTATIYNNTINGGTLSDTSYGITNIGTTAHIFNNTISGGSGNINARAIDFTFGSAATVNNNILFTVGGGMRWCIIEDIYANIILELNNNNFFNCPDALYKDNSPVESLSSITDIETKITNSGGTAGGNTNLDPSFVNAATNDWHLSSTTPCSISKGGQDGAALSWLFTDDIEAVLRTGNGTSQWSMGAYEYDGSCQ